MPVQNNVLSSFSPPSVNLQNLRHFWNRDFFLLGPPRVAHRASSNRSFTSPTSTSDAPPTSIKAMDSMDKRRQNVNSEKTRFENPQNLLRLLPKAPKKSGCLFGFCSVTLCNKPWWQLRHQIALQGLTASRVRHHQGKTDDLGKHFLYLFSACKFARYDAFN